MATRVASLRFEIDDPGSQSWFQRFRTQIKGAGDDTRNAAQAAGQAAQQAGSQITTAWNNVARATTDNLTAQKNLQQAMQAVQKAGTDDAKAILNLAAAQKAAADASARLASAQKDVADSTKKGEEGFNGIESAEKRGHIAGQLISRTLGIEVGRALENVISHSKTLGPIMAAAFSIGVFIAAASAIVEVGKKIADAAEAAGGMTEKVKEIVAEMKKANQEKFFNPDNLKDAKEHIQQLNEQRERLAKAAATTPQNPNQMVNGLPRHVVEQFIPQQKLKKLDGIEGQNDAIPLIQNAGKLANEELQKLQELSASATERGLKGYALANRKLDDALKLLDIATPANQKPQTEKDGTRKGGEVYLAARKAAYAEYAASVREINRQSTQEQMAADDKVAENSMHDENRIRQEEADHIKELRAQLAEKLGMSEAQVEKTREFQAKVALIHQEAALKIKQQDIEVMKIQQQTNDQIAQRGDAYLVGTAKILAAQQRELAGIKAQRDELQKTYGNEQTDVRIAKERGIAAQEVSINEAAAQQIKQAHKQAAEEIAAAQEETALASVPLWQRATAQIEISLTKRLKSIDEESQKEIDSLRTAAKTNVITQQQADDEITNIEQETQARRVALWDAANLKIREEHKRQVDALGSELESVFSDIGSGNIGKRILANMKKLFAQILAEWILSMGQMKSGAGSILGSLVFGPGSTGAGVFGGGGNNSGSVLGGLFGGGGGIFGGGSSSSAGSAVGGTPPFIPPGISVPSSAGPSAFSSSGGSTGQLFGSSLGNIFGQGTGTAGTSAGSSGGSASATTAAALGLGGFFGQPSSSTSLLLPGGPLSTQSISDTIGAVTGKTSGTQSTPGGLLGLGNLLHGGVANSLTGLGAGLAPLLGGLAGGTIGQVGGVFTSLLLTAVLNPTGPIAGLLAHIGLGIGGPLALAAGPIAGGLLGLGIGLQHGGLAGALSGGLSGAGIGFLFGGPVGAIIGGIVGLLGGIFGGIFGGNKRKKQANSLADSILPDVTKIVDEYKSFQLTAASANQQLDQIETQAKTELGKLKGEGKSVLDKRIEPAIADARQQIAGFETERNRRSGLVFGPPQFHEGGIVNATVQRWNARPNELLAVLKDQEFVVNPQATSKNLKTLQRINAGETITGDIGDVHMHFYERVDEVYMRNKGMQVIMDTLRRAQREGLL